MENILDWLTRLIEKKSNATYRDLAIRRVLEADDHNQYDRRRGNPPERQESRIEAARRTR